MTPLPNLTSLLERITEHALVRSPSAVASTSTMYTPTELGILRSVGDALFATWDGAAWLLARAAPWVLQWSPLLTGHGLTPMAALPKTERIQVLQALAASSNGALLSFWSAFKVIFSTVYFEHPDVLPSLGIDTSGMFEISHEHLSDERKAS